jgi:hypothetical protein
MRTSIILIASSLLLAGCTTTQERAAEMQAEVDNMVAVYGPACTKLGYPTNSDQWRNCLLSLSTKDEIERGYATHFYGGFGPHPYWGAGGWWGPYW